MQDIAISYRLQGRQDEAKLLYERAAQGRKEQPGVEHLDSLRTIVGLGLVAEAQGRYGEAENLYRQALKRLQKKLADQSPEVLRCLESITRTLELQGDD